MPTASALPPSPRSRLLENAWLCCELGLARSELLLVRIRRFADGLRTGREGEKAFQKPPESSQDAPAV
eukprot:9480284-Pyramimonas_sp.AAC.1